MNKLLNIITFIKDKRKILISLFLTIGIFSAIVDGFILVQRPQTYRSKAAFSISLENKKEFISPKGLYKLTLDKRYWSTSILDSRVVFSLNKEYGFARLDITEGESDKDLDSLTNETIKGLALIPIKVESVQFKGQPTYLITYKEAVFGQDVFFHKQIVKIDGHFFIFEKRAPLLGYDQSYLDNLLETISFNTTQAPQIKGISENLIDLTTVELVDLIRPSIANIVYFYCLDIVNLIPKLSGLSQPKYHFCTFSKGSGFVINEQGVVATNGHVIKVFPEEGLVSNILNQGSKTLTHDLIKGLYLAKGQTPSVIAVEQFYKEMNSNPQYIDRFLTEIFDLIGKKIISVNTSDEKYYVNVGNEPAKIDYQRLNKGEYDKVIIPSATTYTADLVGFDYPNKYSFDAIVNKKYTRGADIALLRINNSDKIYFPALKLSNEENLKEGSDVVVAGYPTLVEGEEDPRAAISYKTSTKPTITKGIISAIKQDLTGKTVFQTDASIDHGNSGGPAFNMSGQVIGIATFMEESRTGNFNFLREVSELKELISINKVENKLGDISNFWRAGLDNYRNKYYQKAIQDFKQVKALNTSHPTVDEFIKLSEEAITSGESLEGLAGFIRNPKVSNTILIAFGTISVVSFLLAGFLTLLPLFEKRQT